MVKDEHIDILKKAIELEKVEAIITDGDASIVIGTTAYQITSENCETIEDFRVKIKKMKPNKYPESEKIGVLEPKESPKRIITKKELLFMIVDLPDDAELCVEQFNQYNEHQFAEFNKKISPVVSPDDAEKQFIQ